MGSAYGTVNNRSSKLLYIRKGPCLFLAPGDQTWMLPL